MPYLNSEDATLYRELRRRKAQGDVLSPIEIEALSRVETLHDQADNDHFIQVTARVQAESASLALQNQHLRDFLARKQELADRLEAMLTELRREQQAMDNEIAHLLTPSEAAQLAATHLS